MSCNCKKVRELESRYGENENEGVLMKMHRYAWRIIMFIVMLLLAVIVVPVMIFLVIYNLAFKNKMNIVLPNFLGKFLK